MKNIKKIKNIKPIDGDLAEEMKDEIKRGAETDYESTDNQKKDKRHKIKVLRPFQVYKNKCFLHKFQILSPFLWSSIFMFFNVFFILGWYS